MKKVNDSNLSSTNHRFLELKWESRAGPMIVINIKKKTLGLALFCHRKQERSITLFGYTSPVCSRCTGIGIGILAFAIMFLFQHSIPFFLQMIFLLPMLIDGFSQLLNYRESNNVLRIITGFLFSLGFLSLLVS